MNAHEDKSRAASLVGGSCPFVVLFGVERSHVFVFQCMDLRVFIRDFLNSWRCTTTGYLLFHVCDEANFAYRWIDRIVGC